MSIEPEASTISSRAAGGRFPSARGLTRTGNASSSVEPSYEPLPKLWLPPVTIRPRPDERTNSCNAFCCSKVSIVAGTSASTIAS
jgi:hypothetical protein